MVTPTTNCTIARPDPRRLWESIASRFSATVLGGADIIPESNEWYVTALNYAMAEEFYAYADQLYKETDPRTACCDNLVSMAADWGMYPNPATFSEGYVQLRGEPGATLVDPLEMLAGGIEYRSTGRVPARLGGNGRATVRFRALEPGPQANLDGVTQGRLQNPPAGVNTNVVIYGGQFCGGAPEETCEQFRTRFIERMAYRPRATNAWLVEKIMEWPCVTRVCDRAGECCLENPDDCCSCANCQDNVCNDFYVMFDGTFDCGAAPQCVLDEIQEWLFGPEGRQGRGMGQAPIGVCGRLHAVRLARFDMAIDVHDCITPNQQEAIEQAVREYLQTVCPSTEIPIQALSVVIGQVIGVGTPFDVTMTSRNPNLANTDVCGSLIPICDVLPCLADITFTGPDQEEFPCP